MTALHFDYVTRLNGNSEQFEITETHLIDYFKQFIPDKEGYVLWSFRIKNLKVYKKNIPIVFSPEIKFYDDSKLESDLMLGRFAKLRCEIYTYFASPDNVNDNVRIDFEGAVIEKESENRKLESAGNVWTYKMRKDLIINALQYSGNYMFHSSPGRGIWPKLCKISGN